MSPYLTALRARYDATRAELEQLMNTAQTEQRDLTADELQRVRRLGGTGTELADMITEAEAVEQRNQQHAELGAELARSAGQDQPVQLGAGAPDPYAALGAGERVPALMPPRAQVAELYRAIGEQRAMRVEVDQRGQLHTRAVVTLAGDVGSPVAALDPQQPREPRRIAVAAGLTVQNVNGVEGVAFPVFGAGAAGIAAENVTKPEYDAISPGTATPQMISVWTDYTRQAALSVTSFEQRLRGKHAALVARREDQLLVSTVLATTGIQTYTATASAPYADTLLAAAARVVDSDVAAEPDIAVINPADVAAVFGGATGRGGESPEADLRLTLHGMTVYVSSAVAAGAGLVGAWRASSRLVVGLRPTVLIDAVSGLKSNRITSLLEEAVALAVDEPTGFVSVDFTAA
jgi:hypothetical protein